MSQQEEEPSRYTRTLVVKPALSQMYDQLLPTSKSLEICVQTPLHWGSAPRHVRVPRSRNFSDCSIANCPLETTEPSRDYARVPGYKKKYKKKTRKRREKKRKMNGAEINTRAYVATRLLLRWDYLYAVTLKTKVFGDYNHARLEESWITSTRGLLLRGYTGAARLLTLKVLFVWLF